VEAVVSEPIDPFVLISEMDDAGLRKAIEDGEVDPNAMHEAGHSLLFSAVFMKDIGKVRVLLSSGAKPNLRFSRVDPFSGKVVERGASVLHAVDDIAVASVILEYGGDPFLPDDSGMMPVHRAAIRADGSMVDLFVSGGNFKDSVKKSDFERLLGVSASVALGRLNRVRGLVGDTWSADEISADQLARELIEKIEELLP
jgi:ankyrin repeat protein